jgi:hypothetical protein
MSITPTPPARPPAGEDARELKIVSHSNLFYWWPVWAVGFLLSALTAVEDYRLAVLPAGTTVEEVNDRQFVLHLTKPPSASLAEAARAAGGQAFPLYVSADKNFGVLYVVVLLLVIFITNTPLRGMWSVFVIALILLLSLVLALFHLWEPVLESLGHIHIHMTLAGFLVPSAILFLFWLVVVFIFDARRYVVFTQGQIRVHQDIGGSEQVYDATGMTFRKRRSDLFRHWVLGLGSGDLVINTGGAQPQHIELDNVLFVGRKEQQIADLMKLRAVVP